MLGTQKVSLSYSVVGNDERECISKHGIKISDWTHAERLNVMPSTIEESG
jgi:hypothetical protein